MDIEKPVYQTIVVNSAIIEQGMAAAAIVPGGPASMDPGLARVINTIREIRAIGALEGSWLTARWTIYLKDLEAAIAASQAAAEAAVVEGDAGAADEAPAEGEATAVQ
jgi:predicted Zn-dependent protease